MSVFLLKSSNMINKKTPNKSFVLIIKPVAFFSSILSSCIDVALTCQPCLTCSFFSEVAKITFPMLKWYPHCFRGDIVFTPKFLVHVCVHTCVHGMCVFAHLCACTCIYVHVCGCMSVCICTHMINYIVWLREWTQEAACLSINLSPAPS